MAVMRGRTKDMGAGAMTQQKGLNLTEWEQGNKLDHKGTKLGGLETRKNNKATRWYYVNDRTGEQTPEKHFYT